MLRPLLVTLLLFALVGCDSGGEEGGSDLLRVAVETPDGQPVEGLEVGISYSVGDGNRVGLREGSSGGFFLFMFPNPVRGSATLQYELATESRVTIEVFDLEQRKVDTVLDDAIRIGLRTESWSTDSLSTPGVYQVLFRAEDDDMGVVRDTLYAVHAPDSDFQSREIIFDVGETNGQGRVTTDNRFFFPALYDLPPIDFRNGSNVNFGTINFGRTVDIVVSEGAREQTFVRVIQNEDNDFTLVWDPE